MSNSSAPAKSAPEDPSVRATKLEKHVLAFLLFTLRKASITIEDTTVSAPLSLDALMTEWRESAGAREDCKVLSERFIAQMEEFGFQLKAPKLKDLEDLFKKIKTVPERPAYDEP